MEVEDVYETIPTENESNIMKARETSEHKNYTLPLPLRALRKLQNETRAVQFEFFERIYELETEFQKKHELIYKRRHEIIIGDYVPTEAEGNINDISVPKCCHDKNAEKQIVSGTSDTPPPISGIPLFWFNVLSSAFRDIHENDRPFLEYLTDIRVRNKPISDRGFILEFHFLPNEYFENTVLAKEYFYTRSDKSINEFPVIHKSVGCEIRWNDGKAPTHRSWIEILVSSKAIYDSEDEIASSISGIQKDFEMGYFIKEHIVPKAVLYWTGEKNDLFFVPSYNPEYWFDSLSDSPTDDDTTSSENEAKNDPMEQPKNEAEEFTDKSEK